ncbi:acyl-CoA thioesterase [Paraburkholderia ferrariae]|uniref:acyl-CoA thioesterase n=1 Tax=Paraburkholderia ferrariae TaxID=386056 RepID=UPI0005AA68BC|nr:thioesterase family protein [Paraburkholderia ferrariae]
MNRPVTVARSAYPHFLPIGTRWMDNDVYGHVNNVVYYSYFDTVVNEYLIRAGALDIEQGATIGLVVETQCNYFAPLVFPERVDAGLRVARLGSSSVRYEVGLFREGETTPAAQGHFVHVYVDRATRRPVSALPDALRAALEPLVVPADAAAVTAVAAAVAAARGG